MGQRHVVRQSDGAQAMFGRFFITSLIQKGDGEPVMTGWIIIINLQFSDEGTLSLLPFSQLQVHTAELLLQMADILVERLDFF